MTDKASDKSKETKVTNETKSEVKNTRQIDYAVVSSGPLYFDPKHKKPGYTYQFVDAQPGGIEMYQRWGYDVVNDDNDEIDVGQDKVTKSSRFGSAVTVQSKCGRLLVLMAISDELHAKLMDYRAAQQRENDKSIGVIDGIPEKHLIGSINISNQDIN